MVGATGPAGCDLWTFQLSVEALAPDARVLQVDFWHFPSYLRQISVLLGGIEEVECHADVEAWASQVEGSGKNPNTGRCGFLGHIASEWSSSRHHRHLAIARVHPVNASLYSLGSVEVLSGQRLVPVRPIAPSPLVVPLCTNNGHLIGK